MRKPLLSFIGPMAETSKKNAPILYSDIEHAGGLVAAIAHYFAQLNPKAKVHGLPNGAGPVCAIVVYGKRFSQVYLIAEERAFAFDCWLRGVIFSNAVTNDYQVAMHAIGLWVLTECVTDELQSRFPFVSIEKDAKAYETGHEVEEKWQQCFDYIPRYHYVSNLTPFLHEAAQHPQLRQLFPYTTLGTFHFSRCTGQPYSGDCPSVFPIEDNLFEVSTSTGDVIGRGNAAKAVDLVVRHLPPNTGPAIFVTADEL